MSKTFALLGTMVAVAMAFVTADMESPAQRRIRKGGRDLRLNPAFLTSDAPATADGMDSMTDGTTPVERAKPADPATKKPKEPNEPIVPEILFEPRTIDNPDLVLCIADNGDYPPAKVIVELEILMEGEVFWYHPKESKEQESDKKLGERLNQRRNRQLAIVPHEFSNWMRFREICEVARSKGFGMRLWIGVGSDEEPKTLSYLPIPLDPDGTADIKDDEDYFVVSVKEKGDQPEYKINGAAVESLGADMAIAWMDWKKAHPAEVKNIDDTDTTPVVLDVHRYTPMKYVVKVIDRLRGIGLPCERIAGDKVKRRR